MKTNRLAALFFALVIALAVAVIVEAAPRTNKNFRVVRKARVGTNVQQRVVAKHTPASTNVKHRVLMRTAHTNAVRALATPENFRLLKSTDKADETNRLALVDKLIEAILADEERTEAGRLKWHGRHKAQRIDMTARKTTYIHEDGAEFTIDIPRQNLTAEVAMVNKKLPPPPMTNGVPRALMMARLRRFGEKVNPVTNVVIDVNATWGVRPK